MCVYIKRTMYKGCCGNPIEHQDKNGLTTLINTASVFERKWPPHERASVNQSVFYERNASSASWFCNKTEI